MRAGCGRQGTALRREFERWRRKHGGRGSRIPEGLWAQAAEVARTEGVYATARALRLNYERPKERVAGLAQAPCGSVGSAAAAFIEVPMGPLGGGRMLVELVGRGGEQMRIQFASVSSAELVGLAQAFWSRPA